MELTPKNKRAMRLQTWTFVMLFLAVAGLTAWLSTRYKYEADWTAAGRHTLSEASVAVLDAMPGPVNITAFTGSGQQPASQRLRKAIGELIKRYQRHKPDISLTFKDLNLEPDAVRELGITVEGELVVEYNNRKENLKAPSEQAITNALQRLVRSAERRLVFLQGHGERKPGGEANHDLGEWGAQLKETGVAYQTLNLSIDAAIPEDAAALVIASPQVDLLEGEVEIIKRYVERGGNLLWLADPGPLHNLEPLAKVLGVEFKPGTIVDPTGQLLRISHPAFI
ncbi:MAG TPA: ABC transporter, partial [Chromatiales bacterium]|nr:ABC transporter [Chromatiales bacterium]